MKLHKHPLPRLTALLLAMAMSMSFTCLAADADTDEAPVPEASVSAEAETETPTEPKPEVTDEPKDSATAETETEAVVSDEDAEEAASEAGQEEDDSLQAQAADATAGYDDTYTLPVHDGDDISAYLERAMSSQASTIVIPAGTYSRCDVSFKEAPDVTIEAQGATIQDTSLDFDDSSSKVVIHGGTWKDAFVRVRSASNFELRPELLTINKEGGSKGERAPHGLYITNSKNVVLENIIVQNAGNDGIYLSGESDATIINPTVQNSYFFGIAVRSDSKLTLEGGLVTTSGRRPRSEVSRDDAKAGGLSVTEGSQATVTDTTFSKNVACGVAVSGSSKSEHSIVNLYGVQLLNNGDHGVGGNPYATVNMDESKKQRCLVKSNAHNGVQVIDSSSSDFIKGTDFVKNGQDGLSIAKKSTVKLVQNCTMKDNKKHGVMIRKDSVVKKLSKCSISNNKEYGILINYEKGTSKTSAGIADTKLQKNGKDGLRLMGKGSSASVKKCTISENKLTGIVVQDKASLNSLTSTKVTKNGRYGIRVYSKCTVGSTSGTSFSGNKGKQISVDKGAKTKLKTKK